MKQPQDFISASEAAAVTGLSVSTLGTFAEAGYLHVEVDSDGLHLFSRSELNALFGTSISSGPAEDASLLQPSRDIQIPPASPPDSAIQATTESAAPSDPAHETEAVASSGHISPAPLSDEDSTAEGETEEAAPHLVHREPLRSVGALRREITKLRTVVELQERIISMKDKQIKDLKEQRDWLHTRIERSDEKHHRDQILLLSETQTIRELIKQNQRKSPLRAMLEFFRVVPSDPSQPQLTAPPASESSGKVVQ